MALPVTITGISTAVGIVGPFKSSGGNYYFFGRDGTTATTLQAFKSTAPDTSWASVTTKTGFTTAILKLDAYQVSDVIHLLVQDGTASTALATKYVSFNMANDTFLATTETVSAAVAVTGQVAGVGAGASLVVRSNGNVVAFYNGVQTKTSSTFRARVYYRIRTALNTWGTETQVDPSTAFDNVTPIAILGASDRVHFVWASPNVNNRTLSAANALNTATTSASLASPGDGVSYDRSGTTKIVVTSNATGQTVQRFDSSDNPTASYATPTAANATLPHRIGVDTSTYEVTIAYRNSADSDIYAIKSTDNGATFGTAASLFVGTVASADANLSRSSSGSMYQRGTNFVVGYVVNDNGTLKYNEYIIRSGTTGTAAGIGAANAVGATILARQPSAAGIGAAAGVGRGIAQVTASAGGVGAANAVGAQIATVTASASGIGAATATGQAVAVPLARAVVAWFEVSGTQVDIAAATGTAAGIGAAAATGASIIPANASTAAGVGAAPAVSVIVLTRQPTATGTGVANGVGSVVVSVQGTALGVGGAPAVGAGIGVANASTAAGIGTAPSVGATILPRQPTVAGIGAANAVGGLIAGVTGTAAGVGAANGSSGAGAIISVQGTAQGVSTAPAIGQTIRTAATVTAAGVGTAIGNSQRIAGVTATAAGVGTAIGSSRYIVGVTATAPGVSTAPATSAAASVIPATDLVAPTPVLGTPVITQKHVLSADSFTAPTPGLGTPAIGQIGSLMPINIVTGSPVLDTPSLTQNHIVAAAALVAPTPTLGAPSLTQWHSLTASSVVAPAPVLAPATLTQRHNLSAISIVTAPAELGLATLAQTGTLLALPLTTPAPVFGTPTVPILAFGLTTPSPILGTPVLGQDQSMLQGSVDLSESLTGSVIAQHALLGEVDPDGALTGVVSNVVALHGAVGKHNSLQGSV